jgi:hypothetical protein
MTNPHILRSDIFSAVSHFNSLIRAMARPGVQLMPDPIFARIFADFTVFRHVLRSNTDPLSVTNLDLDDSLLMTFASVLSNFWPFFESLTADFASLVRASPGNEQTPIFDKVRFIVIAFCLTKLLESGDVSPLLISLIEAIEGDLFYISLATLPDLFHHVLGILEGNLSVWSLARMDRLSATERKAAVESGPVICLRKAIQGLRDATDERFASSLFTNEPYSELFNLGFGGLAMPVDFVLGLPATPTLELKLGLTRLFTGVSQSQAGRLAIQVARAMIVQDTMDAICRAVCSGSWLWHLRGRRRSTPVGLRLNSSICSARRCSRRTTACSGRSPGKSAGSTRICTRNFSIIVIWGRSWRSPRTIRLFCRFGFRWFCIRN